MASNALAAARAAGVNPDLVYVPRPSATPAQQAEVEETGTVAPLYTANPAPMGLAYYGLSGTGTGTPTATTLTTTEIQGSANVNALWGEDLYQADPDSFSIQMNAVLTDVTLFGTPGYSFWTQDIATYSLTTQTLMLVTNIWNFSGVQLSPNYLYSTGGDSYTNDFGEYSTLGFYYSEYILQDVTEPFDVTLTMTSGLGFNYVGDPFDANYSANSVTFGASLSYNGVALGFPDLDQVTFNSVSSSDPVSVGAPAPYTASGTQLNPLGLTDDFELVICGPGGGSNVDIGDANVDLWLNYSNADNEFVEIPAAYSYGGDTGESSTGVSVDYFGNSPSSYYGWVTGGPSILTGLWGTGAPGGDGYLTLDESPANAFNFFIYQGASGFSSPISFEQAFAPSFGVQSPTFYLMPGDYSILSELADYMPEVTQVVVTFGEPASYSISLTRDVDYGVYTPLWAFTNAEVAEFALSGSGLPSTPYMLDNNQPGSFSPNFGLYNDYGYPVFPGVFFDGINSSVELYEPPSFNASTNDSQSWGDDLPQWNDLQYWFWGVSNVALVNATNISGWFGGMGYSPLYFNSFNVVFYDSSDNLVAGNSFFTESQALLMYTGLSGPDYNTVWGNQFVQIAAPHQCPASSSCLGLVPYDFGLGMEIGEDFDLIYNNLFATPTTAWLLPLNLVTSSHQLYPHNQWNIASEPASTTNYLVAGATLSTTSDPYLGFPTIPLSGSIVGGMTQSGNSWWDQGVALNWDNGADNTDSTLYDENAPTLLDPLSGYPTYLAAVSATEYPCNPAVSYSAYVATYPSTTEYYCATYIYGNTGTSGDNSPLATITESVSFEAEGSGGGAWAASVCGPSAKPPGGPPPSCGPSAKPPGGLPPGEGSIESLWLYTSFTTSATEVSMLLPPDAYSSSIPVSPPNEAAENQLGAFTVTGTSGSPVPPAPVSTTFAPGYTETATESGLPTGSVWWFNVTGRLSLSGTVSPSSNTISSVLPDGTYSYVIRGPSGYSVTSGPATGTFTVSGMSPPGISVMFSHVGQSLAVSPSAGPNPTQVGALVTISAGDTGGVPPYTYAWSGSVPGCTVAIETSESFSCTPTTAGTYTIMLTETDSTPTTATGSLTLTVNSALIVSPSATPSPDDVGQTTTISAGASYGVGPYTYVWSGTVPGCTVGKETSSSFSCSPSAQGSFTITVTATDSIGSRATGSFTLTVNVALAGPTISVSRAAIDSGQSATLSTTTSFSGGTSPYTCQWLEEVPGASSYSSLGTSFSCTAGSFPTVSTGSLTTTGVWQFELQVTDSGTPNEVVNSNSVALTVDAALAVAPSASPNPTPAGASTTIMAGDSGGVAPYTYEWGGTVPGCAVASETSEAFSCTPTTAGSYTISLTETDSVGSTVSRSFVLTVKVAPAITVSPMQGPVGATGTVTGSGFTPSSGATVTGDGVALTPTGCTLGAFSGTKITTSAFGTFTCTFRVPIVLPGSYSVVGHDLATGTASAAQTFTVTLPLITVSPRQGPVGATVTVSGTGFSVSTTLKSLVFDGVSISSCAGGGSLLTSSTGSFSCTFAVPSGTSGTIVTAADVGGVTAIGLFTVTTPKITLSPTSGAPGTTVTVSGTGFSVSTTLKSLVFNGVTITSCAKGSLATTATGTFSCSFTVPSGTPVSTVTVSATDVTGQVATASFKVT